MEKAYWLSRKKASIAMAKASTGSEARLIHYDLAGRYGLKACSAETQAIELAESLHVRIEASDTDRSSGELKNG